MITLVNLCVGTVIRFDLCKGLIPCAHGSETKYFKQEPIQRRFDFSGVLYFGWPNQPSSGTLMVPEEGWFGEI